MPIHPAVQALADDAQHWRRELHRHPELDYDVGRTAKFVADRLHAFGCDEVNMFIGRSGVVGVIKGRRSGANRAIGLRADMDALPIHETTNLPWQSTNPGKMHACGHDGHTAMLLGAARYLARTRDFAGALAVIFQPAEEGGAGAKAMLDDGLMTRWKIEEVYGMHNAPSLPIGAFAIRKGAFLAAADRFTINIEGRGGHAAQPHLGVDPIVAGAQIVVALQSIVARGADPLDSCVVSVTRFDAGTTFNVIPQNAQLLGTVRTLNDATRDFAERRVTEIAKGIGAAMGASVDIEYVRGYPVTRNHARQTEFATQVARQIVGDEAVVVDAPPIMGAEDFSYMLEARPGAFIFVGNGDSAALHHPGYDFNDSALPYGMSYWVELAQSALTA